MIRAARPAAAATPANAVWRAPPAEEEEVPPVAVAAWDAAEPALEALEARLDATELALEIAPLAEEPREDAPEAAEAAAPESC